MTASIGIVLGSYSDVARMEPGIKRLQALQIPFEVCIASAHRTPARLAEWLDGAEARGVRVVIAGAGAAAHLPGVVASKTLLPVIGVPFNASPIGGTDALYSIVQMPPGIPVATVGIDSAENAAVLGAHILAVSDPAVRDRLRAYRGEWAAKIEEQNARLYEAYPEARPAGTLVDEAEAAGEGETRAAETAEAPTSDHHVRLDPDMPDVAAIERAVEVLRGGGVIALPTDTVYGLAADATNAEAVARLYALKGREAGKPIAVLVDSAVLFRRLITHVPEGVEELVDRYWPGPLSIVGRKRPDALPAVSEGDTLAVRVPDSFVALGVVNLLDSPLATTSANLSGQPPATTADEVLAQFGDSVDLVLDAGPTGSSGVSTVLSVMETPFRILRQGTLTREALREVLGDLLAD